MLMDAPGLLRRLMKTRTTTQVVALCVGRSRTRPPGVDPAITPHDIAPRVAGYPHDNTCELPDNVCGSALCLPREKLKVIGN